MPQAVYNVSIRKQVALVLVLAALLYGLLHWQVERLFILPQFLSLQETEATQDAQRVSHIIKNELASLTTMVADWAAWDDTYAYVDDQNEEYAQSNLIPESLIHTRINLLALFDLEGQLVWGMGYDWRDEEEMSLSLLADRALPPTHVLLQHESADSITEGVLVTPDGLLLISAMAIVTSEREGPSRGTFMMGRLIDEPLLEKWRQDLSVEFTLGSWESETPTPEMLTAQQQTHRQSPYLQHHPQEQVMVAYQSLADLEQHGSLYIRSSTPTALLTRGLQAMRFSILSIFGAGALLFASIYLSLHWTMLGRLRHFSNYIQDISQKGDLSQRIEVSHGNEMSLLETGFNSMLHNLEASNRALQQSEETYRKIFNAVQDCLLALNPKGIILAANPSARKIFGLTPSDIGTRDMQTLVYSDSPTNITELVELGLTQTQATLDLALTCSNGQPLEVKALARPTRMLGQDCVLVVLRDIEEHREITHSLHQAREDARKAQAAKSGLLRNVTHEMRSPLNHILGFCTLLSEDPLSPTHQEYLSHIRTSSEELMALVNSIIDISRMESGDLSLEIIPHPLASLLHEAETIARTKARGKGLDFELICADNLPETLATDPQRLLQCLKILIDNAVKFTTSGTIQIKVYTAPQDHPTTLCLAVIDQGSGFQTQEYLLEAFTQADTSATRSHGGLGTGLAVTQGLIHMLGGQIDLQSDPGQGTTVTLSLPLSGPTADLELSVE